MTRLAETAGLTQPMIAFIEKEVKAPTVDSLFRLATALGTTPGEILTAVDKIAAITPPVARKKRA